MSKTKKRHGNGYHIYYMCQNYHSKGKTVCKPNLIKKEIVEGKVLETIKEVICEPDLINEVLSKLESGKKSNVAELTSDLVLLRREIKKSKEEQLNLDKQLLSGDKGLKIEHYNRISDRIQERIDELNENIAYIERQIERNDSNNNINKEIIIDTLRNFEVLFEKANGEEKKLLIRSLIKNVEMEKDRKEIKSIAFWFSEGNGPIPPNDLPPGKVRRTVPQIEAKKV
jgi:site-specific DNA recombinase